MSIVKNAVLSLIYFILGLLLIIAFDYSARVLSNELDDLFMPEMLWFTSHIILSCLVFTLFLKRAKRVVLVKKLVAGLVVSLVAFVFYNITLLVYVIETGIDSL